MSLGSLFSNFFFSFSPLIVTKLGFGYNKVGAGGVNKLLDKVPEEPY